MNKMVLASAEHGPPDTTLRLPAQSPTPPPILRTFNFYLVPHLFHRPTQSLVSQRLCAHQRTPFRRINPLAKLAEHRNGVSNEFYTQS